MTRGETFNSDCLTEANPSSSSSEEDDYQRDVQLKKDIHQLERTLNNYDSQFERRERDHRELAKHKLLKLKVS